MASAPSGVAALGCCGAVKAWMSDVCSSCSGDGGGGAAAPISITMRCRNLCSNIFCCNVWKCCNTTTIGGSYHENNTQGAGESKDSPRDRRSTEIAQAIIQQPGVQRAPGLQVEATLFDDV